jgi:hypothetical protein
MTIDDKTSAFSCASVPFFASISEESKTHFNQLIRAFYRIFTHRHAMAKLDSIPAASTIFLCFNGLVLGVLEPLFGPEDCGIYRSPQSRSKGDCGGFPSGQASAFLSFSPHPAPQSGIGR